MDVQPYLDRFTRRDWDQPTENGPVRLAVVGLGGFARERALPAIARATLCEATVVVSGSSEKADEIATDFRLDYGLTYDEFQDGTAVDAYDAVYIATPPAFHLDYTKTATEFGKHVLCEKPMETSSSRAEQMVQVCEEADVTLMIAYRLQTEPAVRRMRELIRDGFVGEPVQLNGGFSSQLLANNPESDQWRLDPTLAGGGALVDLGVYPLNTSRFLLDSDPSSVQGTTVSTHEEFADVDEHVSFQLSFPEGVTATCTASFNAHPDSRLQVLGTEGQILIEAPFGGIVPQDITLERGDMRTEYVGHPVDEVTEEFDYFATCVLTESTPEPNGADGVADMRAIEAIYEATETGSQVTL
ncbi:gfo/Idh/MocA family oxidoreductase [Halobacteriales archaeon QH_6_64_20]|jgi:xylose dehydrogenase (NAD/NADP)|nr:MAG: gfo/Idh/MocA family oxidoreductase [Halobacteriales archaeon QH_6_64_20]